MVIIGFVTLPENMTVINAVPAGLAPKYPKSIKSCVLVLSSLSFRGLSNVIKLDVNQEINGSCLQASLRKAK